MVKTGKNVPAYFIETHDRCRYGEAGWCAHEDIEYGRRCNFSIVRVSPTNFPDWCPLEDEDA